MRLSPILLAGLVLMGTPVWAQSAPPSSPTMPRGEGLTLDQFLLRQTARIMAADTDGDGRVSKAEMLAVGGKGKGQGGGRGDPERMFDRMDTNHDGYLDKDEIRSALTMRFRRMDRNGNGVLTPDERMGGRANREQADVMPAATPPQQP